MHFISPLLSNRKYIFNHYYWLNKTFPVIITMYTINTDSVYLTTSIPDDGADSKNMWRRIRGNNKSCNKTIQCLNYFPKQYNI